MHDEQNIIAQFAQETKQGKEYKVPRSIIKRFFSIHTQLFFLKPKFPLQNSHNFSNMSNPRFFYPKPYISFYKVHGALEKNITSKIKL